MYFEMYVKQINNSFFRNILLSYYKPSEFPWERVCLIKFHET